MEVNRLPQGKKNKEDLCNNMNRLRRRRVLALAGVACGIMLASGSTSAIVYKPLTQSQDYFMGFIALYGVCATVGFLLRSHELKKAIYKIEKLLRED